MSKTSKAKSTTATAKKPRAKQTRRLMPIIKLTTTTTAEEIRQWHDKAAERRKLKLAK